MTRSTMPTLIARLRLAIGDPASGDQVFSDSELQDFLDARRAEIVECELAYRPSTASGGTVSYLEYIAPRGDWEDSPTLKSSTYATLTPTTSDLLTGRWTFASNQNPPVWITGWTYDVAGSAYDALHAWAAKVATDFDFATDQQTFSRSQKHTQLIAMAREYARRMLPRGMRADWHAANGEW